MHTSKTFAGPVLLSVNSSSDHESDPPAEVYGDTYKVCTRLPVFVRLCMRVILCVLYVCVCVV